MVWLIRYAFLALALVCVVSLLGLVAPDAKASNRRRYLYVGSVVVVCAVVCILFQTLVPTEFKVVGEGNEVVETHSLAALKTGSHLSGKASFSFGYLTEDEDYILMVERGDGGYRRKCYSADSVVVYEDAGAGEARVDMVKRFSVIRCTYKFPFIGRWVRDLHLFTRQEVQIHVPKGSIEQGGYDFS